ncbi:YceI family protein [Henriciella mobilis]|uniref:Polyisoprenoid-binding protein n=1 Tax=Henriciella mobilis TaxID=2305467 RepID=A0A399R770_9PROT|nr:YceI family protein [Henriciella mobilis]RIJ26603.1 polyisoprenoid-binding protein [Henriciella mobilis]
MKLTPIFLAGASALLIAACNPAETPAEPGTSTPDAETETSAAEPAEAEPAGPLADVADATYALDKNHAFLSFTVIHGGVSEYTVDFTDFDATLDFNPDQPESSTIRVTIDPMGLNVNYPSDFSAYHPDSPYTSWPEALSKDARFLQAGTFPEITFVSTNVERTGETTGTVTGDLTFLGVTRPVTLDVTFNGVGNTPWTGERDILGFNASTTITRSEYGQESLQGVISDEVEIEFSGEFLQEE